MGDAVLLGTLPQGRARLATLTVTEIMRGRNAKPKPEEDGMNPTSVSSRSTEPPSKRARAHGENPDTGRAGAAEHDESTTAAAATVQDQPDADADAIGPRAELFEHGAAGDRALIEWLRARQSQPRCGVLLQQICEWKAMDRRSMRNLAKAQGIVVSHRATQAVLEEVRKHFREAIAQEKGRLATFVFQKSRGPSEIPTHHH